MGFFLPEGIPGAAWRQDSPVRPEHRNIWRLLVSTAALDKYSNQDASLNIAALHIKTRGPFSQIIPVPFESCCLLDLRTV